MEKDEFFLKAQGFESIVRMSDDRNGVEALLV